jgi:hypothetical protein
MIELFEPRQLLGGGILEIGEHTLDAELERHLIEIGVAKAKEGKSTSQETAAPILEG